MFLARIGFNADPDPAFYLNADPDPDPGSQINADADPGQTMPSQVGFWQEKIIYVGNMSKNLGTIAILKGWKSYFLNFDQIPCSWIRIRITAPDPGS